MASKTVRIFFEIGFQSRCSKGIVLLLVSFSPMNHFPVTPVTSVSPIPTSHSQSQIWNQSLNPSITFSFSINHFHRPQILNSQSTTFLLLLILFFSQFFLFFSLLWISFFLLSLLQYLYSFESSILVFVWCDSSLSHNSPKVLTADQFNHSQSNHVLHVLHIYSHS